MLVCANNGNFPVNDKEQLKDALNAACGAVTMTAPLPQKPARTPASMGNRRDMARRGDRHLPVYSDTLLRGRRFAELLRERGRHGLRFRRRQEEARDF